MRARLLTAIAIIGFLACSGCAGDEFREPLGASVRQAVEAQKLAAVPSSDTPVTGLDGQYTKNVMENYRKPSAATPAKSGSKPLQINMNSGSSSGSK
ncbi:MAG TPA: hypothetical protein DDW80_08210 [Desulfovibrio sp.]|nr:hypothetical protein [Desulfovibrio sp.]